MPCCLLALCVIRVSYPCRSRQADWLPPAWSAVPPGQKAGREAGAGEHTGCCPPAARPASHSFIPVCGPFPCPLFCSQLTSRTASRFAQHRRAHVAARSAGSCRGPVSQQVGSDACSVGPPLVLSRPALRTRRPHAPGAPCASPFFVPSLVCCSWRRTSHLRCAPRGSVLVEGACGVSAPGCIQSRR